MKWSYPYGTPETEARILGAQGEPRHVLASLARLGYAGVELFVRDPADIDRPALDAALEASGLPVAAIGTGPVVTDDNLTFTDPDPAVREAAVDRARTVVDLAARYDTQVNIGKLRGAIGARKTEAWRWMRQAMLTTADHAADRGVTITIEPQNLAAIDNLNTTRAGLDFVRRLDHPNLALMVDLYHARIEDKWPSLAYLIAGPRLRHVHFADSNRGAPGRGNIDFALHIATLEALGYDRFVTLELDQRGDWLATAAEALRYLNSLNR